MRRSALILIAFAVLAEPAAAAKKDVTVMTRNVYLGADITRPIVSAAGKEGLPALVAFANANDTTRNIVDQTDFPARAKLLAAEIRAAKADLVGLQEVALWRSGSMDLSALGRADATKVDYDFLKLLMKELGKGYKVVRKQVESDVEGPAFAGTNPFEAQNPRDVRLTMRDVILRRKASRVKVTKASSRQYKTRLDIEFSGVEFSFIRGAVWADAKLGRKRFRFVNTHLESQTPQLALAQAHELLKGPAAVKGRSVIVACDCNTDPEDPATRSPHQALTGVAPYAAVGTSPLFDLTAASGPTFGFSETVDDADASAFDQRIDFVFGRKANGTALAASKVTRVGTTTRTAGGLWPSDHAGVVATLRP